ncbi:MAG: TonB-dependent receptor, partial [Silvanigrellales bacterium]|nr:TonB-dependent receptor [Silvanigrellales bacterium]
PVEGTRTEPTKAERAFERGTRSVEFPQTTLPNEEASSVSGSASQANNTLGEASKARSVGQALETSRTAFATRHGGEGGQVSFRLRGARAFEPRYLFEGVPLSSSSEGEQALFLVPLALVGSFRVFPDTAPLGLSGGSAGGVGGTVNFEGCGLSCFSAFSAGAREHSGFASPSKPSWGAHASLSAGSFGARKGALAGAWRASEKATLLVALERTQSREDFSYTDDGGTLTKSDDDVMRRRVNNAFLRTSGGMRAAWRNVPVAGELTFDVLGGLEKRGLPGPALSSAGAVSGNTQGNHSARADTLVRRFGLATLRTRTLLAASGFEVNGRAHATSGVSAATRTASGWRTTTEGEGARQGGGLHLLAPWQNDSGGAWGLGLDASATRQKNETRREETRVGELEATRKTLAPAAHVSRSFWERRIAATADVGLDMARSTATSRCSTRSPGCTRLEDNETNKAEHPLLTGSAGVQTRVESEVVFVPYARVSRAARRPSLGELFGDAGGVLANPRLRSERSTKVETGISFPYVTAAFYAAKDKDLIFSAKAGQASQAVNLEQGSRRGGFLSVDVPFGDAWSLQGGYHFLRARMQRRNEAEATVPRSPEHAVRGGLALNPWRFHQSPNDALSFSASAEGFWQSPFFVDAANLIRFKSSVDARAEAGLTWERPTSLPWSSTSVVLQAENLLDASGGRQSDSTNESIAVEHAGFPGFPEPGRRFYVTLKSHF